MKNYVCSELYLKMPKRPKQHELEDLSRAKFQICLPKKWVLRSKEKDYGIDGEVELFNEEGNAQGILFYVQLKATGSKDISQILNVDFNIETLKYFANLEIPVLLARYSEHFDNFYYKWINSIDLTFSKKEAKTFRVKIDSNSVWNESTHKTIEKELITLKTVKSGQFIFPVSYSVSIEDEKVQDIKNDLFKIQLRNKLNNYSDFLLFKEENSFVNINIDNNVLTIKLSILKGVYFHNLNLRSKENFLDFISQDILLGLSLCFILNGQIDFGGRIIFENNLEKYLLQNKEIFLIILPYLLESSYFEKSLKLIDDSLVNNGNEIFLFPTIINILLNTNKKNKSIEEFFISQLEKTKKLKIDSLIASSFYNLGSFYRRHNENYKSIQNYKQAKKADINYLKREYFYREIAGVCFLAGKFYFSSKFYSKSIELGAKSDTKLLLADSLMFTGKYEVAKNLFLEYINEHEDPYDEFTLKYILLDKIIESKGIKSQTRKIIEANKLADISKSESLMNGQECVENALKLDLLSSLAWFNLAAIKRENDEYEESTYCYAICAIIKLYDIQSWVFSFFMFIVYCLDKIDFVVGSLILKTAYLLNGDDFLIELFRLLDENGLYNQQVIDLINETLIGIKRDNNSGIIRLINQENFNEIEIIKK